MARPTQARIIEGRPRTLFFKPCGHLPESAERIALKLEELEALRLADLEGLTQTEAAARMGVSRHTFGRVLAEARRKSAQALVTGISLEVTGGTNVRRRPTLNTTSGVPMKVAVSAEGPDLADPVDPRFGRAAGFIVADTETGEHVWIDNGAAQIAAQGAGLMATQTVADAGATVVLSGYVGPKACEALEAAGIAVVQDMDNRTVEEALAAWRETLSDKTK